MTTTRCERSNVSVDDAQRNLDKLGELHEWAHAVDAAADALTAHLADSGDWSKATPAMAAAALEASGLPAEVERLRAALREIANEDYRGPRPWSATVAYNALNAHR